MFGHCLPRSNQTARAGICGPLPYDEWQHTRAFLSELNLHLRTVKLERAEWQKRLRLPCMVHAIAEHHCRQSHAAQRHAQECSFDG